MDNIPVIHVFKACFDGSNLNEYDTNIINSFNDVVCPINQACWLKQQWPRVGLPFLKIVAHMASESKWVDVLIEATDDLAIEFHSLA